MGIKRVKKGAVFGIILMFLIAGTSISISKQQNDSIHSSVDDIAIFFETQFEDEWILDGDGDYLAPPGWDVDGICVSHQPGVINECYTHYWNILYWDENELPDVDLSYLIHSGESAACVWWSDGSGEDAEVGQNQDEWLITPALNLSEFYDVQLGFWSTYHWGVNYSNHSNFVKVSTDQGETWDIVTDLVHDDEWKLGGEEDGWEEWNHYEAPILIDLSAYAFEEHVLIAWQHIYPSPGMGPGGHAIWAIDDVSISGMRDTDDPEISLMTPQPSTVYLAGEELIQWPLPTIIIGPIEFTFAVMDDESGVDFVELLLNDEIVAMVDTDPFIWEWNEKGVGLYSIQARVHDKLGNTAITDTFKALRIQLI